MMRYTSLLMGTIFFFRHSLSTDFCHVLLHFTFCIYILVLNFGREELVYLHALEKIE